MSDPVLLTKLSIPALKPQLVHRLRLLQRLDAGLDTKLTLLSAPAGYGKTTLLVDWISHSSQQVVWLSLDEQDNHLSTFLSYIFAALRTHRPEIGEEVSLSLRSRRNFPLQRLLCQLVNDIAQSAVPVILILDNYQSIETTEIHEAVYFLLEHLPANLHLFISTRSDPPLPLARLRGSGDINEIRSQELRFNNTEAADLMKMLACLSLRDEDIKSINEHAEGWAAGLQMAALTLKGQSDPEIFIKDFTGSNHYIMDYLVEEVLESQPEIIQSFMLKTSILERLCAPLCESLLRFDQENLYLQLPEHYSALTTSNCQRILEYLEHANLFYIPLDENNEWFRCHQLFSELLRHILEQNEPETLLELHRRASIWFANHGFFLDAIRHAQFCGDIENVAANLENYALKAIMDGEFSTLINQIELLPENILTSHLLLRVYQAGIYLYCGHPLEEVQSILEGVLAQNPADRIRGLIAIFECQIATFAGNWQASLRYAQQALDLLSEEDLAFRSLVSGMMSFYQVYFGDIDSACISLEESINISERAGNWSNLILSTSHLATIKIYQGLLYQSQELYLKALEQGRDQKRDFLPVTGWALLGYGYLLYQWNDLWLAESMINEGLEQLKRWGEIILPRGLAWLAHIKIAQKDFEAAEKLLDQGIQQARRIDVLLNEDFYIENEWVNYWLSKGDLTSAINWANGKRLMDVSQMQDVEDIKGNLALFLRAGELMMVARIYLASGDTSTALRILRLVREITEQKQCFYLAYHCSAYEVIALESSGNHPAALDSLSHLLQQTKQEGFIRLYLDIGTPMLELLKQLSLLSSDPQIIPYILILLAAFQVPELSLPGKTSGILEPSIAARSSSASFDQLSERELEILQLICAGLSNQEIAERLFLSLHTVKWHTSHIYDKLGVNKRIQAVSKASAFLNPVSD